MAKREKRLAAMRQNPKQVRFADLRSVLEGFGFEARPGKGDHWSFVHPRISYVVTVDPRRPHVLEPYVRKALQAIDEVLEEEREAGEEHGTVGPQR